MTRNRRSPEGVFKYYTYTAFVTQIFDVAWELGLDCDRERWKGHGHIINIDGSKFYDFSPEQQKGGGGAIDLVMHVNQCNLRQAVVWLHERFGETGAERAVIAKSRQVAAEIIELEPRTPFQLPVEDKTKWQSVSNYLTQKWGIPANFVQAFHELGLIYADSEQNAVFVMRNLAQETKGVFLRGTRGSDRHRLMAVTPSHESSAFVSSALAEFVNAVRC